ncbi:MAG: hypothetical protein HYT79_01635 [Elusimicrobia bacterium]|nr:hypothetical protein [Elusimicrobiota bacterium]
MKLGLILSNDWEVFGDGSGDFFNIQYEPTEQLLDVCQNHDAKLTLMAEVGYYWAHERHQDAVPGAGEILAAWREQVRNAVARGHDAQLHLHPQWLAARYADGRWRLDFSRWSLSALPYEEQKTHLDRGRALLEGIGKPARASYRCLAYRAGGYAMEPPQDIVRALAASGILADSSVRKKDRMNAAHGSYDYRSAYSWAVPWYVDERDMNRPQQSGQKKLLLEIPIYGEAGWSPWRQIKRRLFCPSSERLHQQQRRVKDAPASSPDLIEALERRRQSLFWKIWTHLTSTTPIFLDYIFVAPTELTWMLNQLHRRYAEFEGILPVMSIGHVKNMRSAGDVGVFLEKSKKALGSELLFWSYQEAVEYLLANPRILDLPPD